MNQHNSIRKQVELDLKWDKTFALSDKVDHQKVSFKNRYGITLLADLYLPKKSSAKLAAIAISGPFGAVKEQSSGLYAQVMPSRRVKKYVRGSVSRGILSPALTKTTVYMPPQLEWKLPIPHLFPTERLYKARSVRNS